MEKKKLKKTGLSEKIANDIKHDKTPQELDAYKDFVRSAIFLLAFGKTIAMSGLFKLISKQATTRPAVESSVTDMTIELLKQFPQLGSGEEAARHLPQIKGFDKAVNTVKKEFSSNVKYDVFFEYFKEMVQKENSQDFYDSYREYNRFVNDSTDSVTMKSHENQMEFIYKETEGFFKREETAVDMDMSEASQNRLIGAYLHQWLQINDTVKSEETELYIKSSFLNYIDKLENELLNDQALSDQDLIIQIASRLKESAALGGQIVFDISKGEKKQENLFIQRLTNKDKQT